MGRTGARPRWRLRRLSCETSISCTWPESGSMTAQRSAVAAVAWITPRKPAAFNFGNRPEWSICACVKSKRVSFNCFSSIKFFSVGVFACFSFCLFPICGLNSKLISVSVSVFSVFVSIYIFHLSVSITSLSLYQSVIYPCVFLCLCLCFYHVLCVCSCFCPCCS